MTTKKRASATDNGLSGIVDALDELECEVGYLSNLTAAFMAVQSEIVGMSPEDHIGKVLRDGLCGLIEALERGCHSLDMSAGTVSAAVSAARQASENPTAQAA